MNPHPVKDTPLKRARMPIPPPQRKFYRTGSCGADTGILESWFTTDIILMFVETFVRVREVNINMHAMATVSFFIKAMPEEALNIWSEPPPPKIPAMPPLFPACKRTTSIRPQQTA